MFYSYENIYISKVVLLLKGFPSPRRIAWGIASVFYLLALCFVFHTTGRSPWYVMLVQNVLSKQAGWIMELNFSLKLLCFMLSQVLQMLILKYYFYAKEKNVQLLPRVGKMKQTLHSNWLPKGAR